MSTSGVVRPLCSSFLPLLFLIVLIALTWRVSLTCHPVVLSVGFQSLIIVCVGSTVWVQCDLLGFPGLYLGPDPVTHWAKNRPLLDAAAPVPYLTSFFEFCFAIYGDITSIN